MLGDQPSEAGVAVSAPRASSIDRGEQSLTDTDVWAATPDGNWPTAATALADSVPLGSAWPRAETVEPDGNWLRLACATVTTVSAEVVTGIRLPLAVTRTKPVVVGSATVP